MNYLREELGVGGGGGGWGRRGGGGAGKGEKVLKLVLRGSQPSPSAAIMVKTYICSVRVRSSN